MVLLSDKWVQQANARKYRLQISDQIGFETASPTLSVICKNWGIPRSGQKFIGWEHSSEPLPRGIHVYGLTRTKGQRSWREPPRSRAGPAKVKPESVVAGGGSAGKWQIPTEAGGTFWLLPSSPVFKIERPKLTVLGSGI
jgi:hypothetical protein